MGQHKFFGMISSHHLCIIYLFVFGPHSFDLFHIFSFALAETIAFLIVYLSVGCQNDGYLFFSILYVIDTLTGFTLGVISTGFPRTLPLALPLRSPLTTPTAAAAVAVWASAAAGFFRTRGVVGGGEGGGVGCVGALPIFHGFAAPVWRRPPPPQRCSGSQRPHGGQLRALKSEDPIRQQLQSRSCHERVTSERHLEECMYVNTECIHVWHVS